MAEWTNEAPYTCESNPRAYMLMINVRFWKSWNTGEFRTGANHDTTKLHGVFGGKLHVAVDNPVCETREDLEKAVEKFATDPKLRTADVCFVVVMSHGIREDGKDYVLLEQGDAQGHRERVEVDWIVRQLCENKDLRGKPKVFLFNYSRAVSEQQEKRRRHHGPPKMSLKELKQRLRRDKPLDRQNTLVCYACQSRKYNDGDTLFIRTLGRKLDLWADEKNLKDILDDVSSVIDSTPGEEENVPQIVTQGFRTLLLKPPGDQNLQNAQAQ